MASDGRSSVKLRAAVQTDVGVVRDHNEDSAHVDSQHDFFVVADGMGGHAAGEVASAMAVDKVREALEAAREDIRAFVENPDEERRKALVKILEAAVRTAHQSVYVRGTRESDKQGMGTTLDVVLVAGQEAFVAHVGDSRTYLMRDGKAAQITTDHTVAEVLVIEGKLSLEEAQISPLRTILVNAIGVAPDVGIEMAHVRLRQGDQLLLCSDGLHDYFPAEQELADHLSQVAPELALHKLVDLAKERGGHDNITGIVIDVLSCDADDLPTREIETTQKMPITEGVPAQIDRDDTLPVPRLVDDGDSGTSRKGDESGKKSGKTRKKRRSKSKKEKRSSDEASAESDAKSTDEPDAAAGTDAGADESSDFITAGSTQPMETLSPDDVADDGTDDGTDDNADDVPEGDSDGDEPDDTGDTDES